MDAIFGTVVGFSLLFALLILAGAIAAGVFYVLTVQKTLRLTFGYQGLNPNLAWLLFIPFFNLVWNFIVVIRIRDGVKGKMGELGRECGDAGWAMGLAASILYCLSFLMSRFGSLHWVVSIAGIVVWVLYWMKLRDFNRVMEADRIPETIQGFPGQEGIGRGIPRFCTHCGARIQGDIRFCTQCGKQVG